MSCSQQASSARVAGSRWPAPLLSGRPCESLQHLGLCGGPQHPNPSLQADVHQWPLQIKANLQMRTRYPDQPEKFMQSEVDLDDEVKKLLVMAGSPELYPVLVVSLAWLLLAADAPREHSPRLLVNAAPGCHELRGDLLDIAAALVSPAGRPGWRSRHRSRC